MFRGGRNGTRAGCRESGPLRTGFEQPASFYMDAYRSYQTAVAALLSSPPASDLELVNARAKLFEHRARARWALSARGVESVPYALEMLKSTDLEEREDARGILGRIGGDDRVIEALTDALEGATDSESVENLTIALGATGNLNATPVLVRILRHPETDEVIKSWAMESIGRIAQRRFDHSEDPNEAMQAWLETNGYRTLVAYTNAGIPEISDLPEDKDNEEQIGPIELSS